MKHRTVRSLNLKTVCLALACATWAPPAPGIERLFTYTHEPETQPQGALEFEQWVTARVGRNRAVGKADYYRLQFREEVARLIATGGGIALRNMAAYLARELGLSDTLFRNSHGLSAEGQYTTARDMAVLARHVVLDHPKALEITAAKEFTWNHIRQPNWNRLVLQDPRVDGLKTGHLPEAGYHLVATASEGDRRLIAVVLGSPGEEVRAREARRLLDYGFRNFATLTLDLKGKVPAELPVYKGRARRVTVRPAAPPRVTVPRGREGELRLTTSLVPYAVAPVSAGERLGTLTASLDGRELLRLELQAGEDVARGGWWRVAWDSVRLFFRNLFRR